MKLSPKTWFIKTVYFISLFIAAYVYFKYNELMINSVSLISFNNIYKTGEQRNAFSPAFQGTKKDVFVSTIPKLTKVTKNKLGEVAPIYLRYRESANVTSSIPEVKRYLQTEFKKGDDSIVCAKQGEKVIGFLHYGIERSTLRPAERIRLKAMFVEDEFRGKGISKQLLQFVQEEAGDKEIIVKARCTNEVSPYLYLNNGFTEDEEYIHLVYKK